MLITDAMNKKLNEQIANELNASYHYLSMACRFDHMGLRIFAARFEQQSDEERGHALRILKYIQDVGGEVSLAALARPRDDYNSVLSIVQAALDSEMNVTRQINDLVALADQQNDYATRSFLQWFVDEQIEEVRSMTDLLQLVKMAGESSALLVEARLMKMMAAKKD